LQTKNTVSHINMTPTQLLTLLSIVTRMHISHAHNEKTALAVLIRDLRGQLPPKYLPKPAFYGYALLVASMMGLIASHSKIVALLVRSRIFQRNIFTMGKNPSNCDMSLQISKHSAFSTTKQST